MTSTRCRMASTHSSLNGISTFFQPISLLLVWILLLSGVESLNRRSEVTSLLKFKDANKNLWGTGPGYWVNWKETDENPCAWIGVTCINNSTVSGLDLSGWANYQGTNDRSIGLFELSNLADLRQLDLSSNRLAGVFDLYLLTGLSRLDLSFNHLKRFPGIYPDEICNLTKLSWLDLSYNSICGPVAPCVSTSRSLSYLSLQQNNLSGEVPTLSALGNLQFLYLAENQLFGPFPEGLVGLRNIFFIDLSNNSFNGTIPALPNGTNLVQLKLDNNNFTGFAEPWFVGANSSLSSLSASYNQLNGVIPSTMMDLLKLQSLNLSYNQLKGSIPMGFPKLPLLSLDLSQNYFEGKIPSDLVENWAGRSSFLCPTLNLSHNLLTGSIPTSHVVMCFYVLDLSYNNLSGPIPSNSFSKYSSISYLWLQNNRLSGDIVDVLFGGHSSPYILECRLGNNHFTGDLTKVAISNPYHALQHIDLRNNNLGWSTSEAIPDPISATLETLNSNGFGRLVEFRAGGNNFSGTPVPNACLVNLSQLQVLDLSNSHLEGEILGSTFNSSCLPSLKVLMLGENEISGPVPEDILMLPNLEVLNLSHNKLSGSLPTVLPNSRFDNPDIFAGNIELCGYPLDPCSHPGHSPEVSGGPGGPAAGVRWWELFLIIGGALTVAMGSCLTATWRWRVYQKRHQQDEDLINTLLERDSATLMPLRELKKATDNFAESAQVGDGGFGTVYAGKLNDGTKVAIKRSKREGSDKDKKQFLNEVRILSQVNHRNLVKLLGCCMENKTAVLVFEFVSNGTLQDHLHGKCGADRLSWQQRLNIAVQTANALTYLHTATAFPIYHRDVKSANILLDEDLNARVADFGISKLAPLQATHVSTVAVQGTMGYIDPEYYTTYRLTDKSDVFSFGVVLLELISSKLALDLSRRGDDSSLVNLATPHITSGDLQELIDPALLETYNDPAGHGRESGRESILNVGRLAMRCVDMRSKARPTMNEVWTDLQTLSVELTGTRNLGIVQSITEDDDEDDHDQDLWVEMSDIYREGQY